MAAEHDGDDALSGTRSRCHDVEAGGVDVAGLDAVDAFDLAEQMIVIAHRLAAEIERARREVAVVGREALEDGAAEQRLIARGGELLVVG